MSDKCLSTATLIPLQTASDVDSVVGSEHCILKCVEENKQCTEHRVILTSDQRREPFLRWPIAERAGSPPPLTKKEPRRQDFESRIAKRLSGEQMIMNLPLMARAPQSFAIISFDFNGRQTSFVCSYQMRGKAELSVFRQKSQ